MLLSVILFLLEIRYVLTPINMYSIVHTIGKTIAGGANIGISKSLYAEKVSDEINTEKAPTTNGIARFITNFANLLSIGFPLLSLYSLFILCLMDCGYDFLTVKSRGTFS